MIIPAAWRTTLSTQSALEVLLLTGSYRQELDDPKALLLAYVNFYGE
jgi:hypothetical protein